MAGFTILENATIPLLTSFPLSMQSPVCQTDSICKNNHQLRNKPLTFVNDACESKLRKTLWRLSMPSNSVVQIWNHYSVILYYETNWRAGRDVDTAKNLKKQIVWLFQSQYCPLANNNKNNTTTFTYKLINLGLWTVYLKFN